MSQENLYLFIVGQTDNNTPLRPHNWAERFAGNLASFGRDRRLRYSDALAPVMLDGIKCLRVAKALADSQPGLVDDILRFADLHGLAVRNRSEPELALAG
ncbi:MAG: hypothetical protein CMN57_08820 [Gammaproteobacteria bacterium]|nr:hypothetical protein [Gammaproteobacteria bacterium]